MPLQGQGDRFHSPHQRPPDLPGHAHLVRAGAPAGPTAGGHTGPCVGRLGARGPATRNGAGGGACSRLLPPWGGAPGRAGGGGTCQGRTTRCTLCRSPSARCNTACATTSAAMLLVSWKRTSWPPLGAYALVRIRQPVAWLCGLPRTELEQSLLQGLLNGAPWMAAQVCGHRMREHCLCPHRGAAHEDEEHVLWVCPEWELAARRSGRAPTAGATGLVAGVPAPDRAGAAPAGPGHGAGALA